MNEAFTSSSRLLARWLSGEVKISQALLDESAIRWPELIEAAEYHGLVPLLYRDLAGKSKENVAAGTSGTLISVGGKLGGSASVDGGIAEREARGVPKELRRAYLGSLLTTLAIREELAKVLQAFREASVEVIALKGSALAGLIYPDPALRQLHDADLLIRESHWVTAREALDQIGFHPTDRDRVALFPKLIPQEVPTHLHFKNALGIDIELQFDPLTLGLRMKTLEQVWATSNQMEIEGVRAGVLSPEYQLFHLCVHLNKHGFRRLVWSYDIALFLQKFGPKLDWRLLAEIARREGLRAPVFFTLSLVRKLLGNLLPGQDSLDQALALFDPGRVRSATWRATWPKRAALSFGGRHDGSLTFRKHLSPWLVPNLLLTGRTWEKASWFARRALPPRDFLAVKYGVPKDWRLYLLYMTRPLRRLVKRRPSAGAQTEAPLRLSLEGKGDTGEAA